MFLELRQGVLHEQAVHEYAARKRDGFDAVQLAHERGGCEDGIDDGAVEAAGAGGGVDASARRFHGAIIDAILTAATLVRELYGIETVALSGGVFMNRLLMEHTLPQLEEHGFTVAINRDLPPNDGCISLGQAVVAWAQTKSQ